MTVYFILKYLHVVGAYCHSGNRNAPVLMLVGLLTWITDNDSDEAVARR